MFDPEYVEFALDDRGGPMFFEPEFGMAVNFATNLDGAVGYVGCDRTRRRHASRFAVAERTLRVRSCRHTVAPCRYGAVRLIDAGPTPLTWTTVSPFAIA